MEALRLLLLTVLVSCVSMLSGHARQDVVPREVKVLVDVELPVPFAVTESVQPVKAGTQVRVKSVHGKQVKVAHGVGEGVVDIAKTDFMERSAVAAKQAAEEARILAEREAEQKKIEAERRKAARNAARNSPRGKIEFEQSQMINAWSKGKSSIQAALKTPKTADFSMLHWDSNTGAKPDGFGRVICWGFVDAQNSFGAQLRNDWRAWVQPDGDRWRLVRAMLNGDVIFDERSVHKPFPLARAEAFLGMNAEEMLSEFGQPLKISNGNNASDGPFKIYVFDETKGRETMFTIWEREGVVRGGMYEGVLFDAED